MGKCVEFQIVSDEIVVLLTSITAIQSLHKFAEGNIQTLQFHTGSLYEMFASRGVPA